MNRNVTATILIVLAAGIYFTLTRGLWNQAQAVKHVNDAYQSAIKSAQQLIKVRDKVKEDYNNLAQEDRDRLDKMVPSTVDNIRLIIDLNSVAVRHGLSLKNIRAVAASTRGDQPARPVGGVRAGPSASGLTAASNLPAISTPILDNVDVSFTVTAPYQQFVSFLQDLEANLRIMDVTHLTVSTADSGLYSFQVGLRTYWLRQ